MERLWICEDYTGCWIRLNKPESALCVNMLQNTYSEHRQTFKMEHFPKGIMPECRCATRNFSGLEVGEVCGTKALRYRFRRKPKKKPPEASQGNILEFFLLDTRRTTFWMQNLTQRWIQSESFFQKSGHFFDFQKGQGRPPPSCSSVGVAKYA